MDKKDKAIRFIYILSIFIIPFLVAIKVVGVNNDNLVSIGLLNVVDYFIIILTLVILLCLIYIVIKKKKIMTLRNSIATILFFMFVAFELTGMVNLVYYNNDFKEWLIKTSISSIDYKNLALSIYGEKTIDTIMDKENKSVDYSSDIIDYEEKAVEKKYVNKYEQEILDHEEDAIYKIIKISGTTIGADIHYEGYLVAIYDPAKVKLAKSSGAGTDEATAYGETLATISRKNNALVAMNAGGFVDPNWSSNGGIPHGDVIIDGKIDTSVYRGVQTGGLIGFDYNNKLILKRMSGEEAINMGIRDAVDWGPFLIVDGVNRYQNVNYYSWACGRSAIGQRSDGIVLFLVIDNLQAHSQGASYADLAQIMMNYGAINAANLDGGTSTSLTEHHQYVNSPWNGYRTTYRWMPNAWIVTE